MSHYNGAMNDLYGQKLKAVKSQWCAEKNRLQMVISPHLC